MDGGKLGRIFSATSSAAVDHDREPFPGTRAPRALRHVPGVGQTHMARRGGAGKGTGVSCSSAPRTALIAGVGILTLVVLSVFVYATPATCHVLLPSPPGASPQPRCEARSTATSRRTAGCTGAPPPLPGFLDEHKRRPKRRYCTPMGGGGVAEEAHVRVVCMCVLACFASSGSGRRWMSAS